MKFRICLRVETPEDSKELLKRPDAARLPQIGGRGYVQAGTELLTEVQAAWAGAPFDGATINDPAYPLDVLLRVLEKQGDPPRSMLGWVVGALAAEAERLNIPKQMKPWPDPLPETLSLNTPIDATYIAEAKHAKEAVINPAIANWIANTKELSLWTPFDWTSPLPLRASVGLIDNPFQAEQRIITIDLASDPLVIFGASGRGKTTFVKTLLLSLAAVRSPHELHIYALDFGRGGLRSLRSLPHLGASIDSSQMDRVEQLFRMVRSMMNERQDKLAKYASLEDYNAQHKDNPDTMFPAVVIVVDNMAEFKENYEYLIPDLIAMVRDGRSFGIYCVITAGQPNDVPPKLYNVLSQRLTFTLSDATAYSDIVGRGALSLQNVAGRGLINIEGQPLEFHAAVPIIVGEKDAYTKIADRMEKVWFAMGGKRPAAEIPKAITLLEMYQVILGKKTDRIGDLNIAENWRRSMLPENQEWLTAPIGLISSKEVRNMIFSAKAGGDGVHGMAAGTTGSGKSELIQTLISAMAIKYDPRIVNFVLVDYKGGPTVEPFRKLPHCVDLATNLQGNAVERIFIAINAEMNRRSEILAKAGVADLVEYRKKVIPTLKPGSPFPDTFPHLFIIVDEFAEMITQNPDYKAKFESITRLGRSFGVSLILATQRPSGAVTDQMRANMKFRICLRVETSDDSKEMLGRPDAATLPAIGGRGYIQVGGGTIMEVQAAWSGAPYDESKPDAVYPVPDILDALDKQNDPPRSLLGWLVGALAAESGRQHIPKQFKPWPDPLPEKLPLNTPVNAEYIQQGKLGKEIVINPSIASWMDNAEGKPLWLPRDEKKPLVANALIGIVDNTFLAEQRVLNIDLSGDPLIIFGAAGRGKTTFLKSLLISLAAQYSPADLHIFALDFGRGGLKALRKLPHVGGIVETNEEERVERLIRMLRNILDERQLKLQAYDSLADYNAKNPEAAFPPVVVAIDNVSEFREMYERFLPDLIALVRDGRSFGMYFVIATTLTNDVPSKLFNLLTQRMTFTLSDPSEYSGIVGRGWPGFNDVPGRGLMVDLVNDKPQPLEFQTAMPIGEAETDYYKELSLYMEKAWATLENQTPALKAKRPKSVEPLAKVIDVATLLPPLGQGTLPKSAALGINDLDREPVRVEFQDKGSHWMVVGPPVTGKTTTLRSLVLALAHSYSPDQLAMVLVDSSDTSRRFFNFGGSSENLLESLPHVLATVTNAKEMDEVVMRLRAEYDEQVIAQLQGKTAVFIPENNQKRSIVVIVDHYDDAESLNKGKLGLTGLSEIGKGKNLHFVVGGTLGILRGGGDEFRKRVEAARFTLVLQDYEAVRYMGARGNFTLTKELPPGRGFLVKAVQASLVQMATPSSHPSPQEYFDQWIGSIRGKYQRAQWSYHAKDLTALEAAIRGEAIPVAAPPPAAAAASDAMAELAKMMSMQANMISSFTTKEIPDATPNTMASVTIEDDKDESSKKTRSEKSRKK
ncbi:MAG: FtsK/SpoIIIE domain-containing protein [Chloroflexota bacterium]